MFMAERKPARLGAVVGNATPRGYPPCGPCAVAYWRIEINDFDVRWSRSRFSIKRFAS